MKNAKLVGLEALEAQYWGGRPLRDCSFEFDPDEDGVQVSSNLDARGRELPDPVPMAPPVGYRDGPSLADFVHRMIRQEVSRIAEDNQYESFEEAEDFDIEDDPVDVLTPYERVFDPAMPRAAPGVEPGPPKPEPGGGGGAPPPAAPPGGPEVQPGVTPGFTNRG